MTENTMETHARTILVIDDETPLLHGMIRLLESAGYHTQGASAGEDGLRLAQEIHPDLILLDVTLPDIDGIEVCRRIKHDPRMEGTYVLLISGVKTLSEHQVEGLEAEADGYVARPIPNRELLARVQALLRIREKERQLAQALQDLRTHQVELEMQNVELRNAHKQLEIQRGKYVDLYDFAPVGYCTFGEQGNILEANLTAASLLGIERDRLVNTPFYHWIVEDDLDTFFLFLRKLFGTSTRQTCEVRLTTRDGSVRYVRLDAVIFGDLANPAGQCRAVISDITERKCIEATQLFLLQSGNSVTNANFFEALARYLAETLDMDYVCIDRLHGDLLAAQTVAVYFDGKFEDNVTYTLHDTPCGDVVGQTICCFPGDVRHLFPHDVVLQEMRAESYVGTTLWSSSGQAIGLIAIISRKPLQHRALTETILKLAAIRAAAELEHVQAEDELRQSEERFRSMFEQAGVGVALLNTKTGQFIRINQKYCDFIGYTMEEMLQKTFMDITYHEDVQTNIDKNALFIEGKSNEFSFEKRYVRKDGKIVWGNLTISPLWKSGEKPQTYYHIAIVENITERKQAEEERDRILNLSSDLICIAGMGGYFKYVNPAWEHVLGYTQEELLSKPFLTFIHPEDHGKNDAEVERLTAGYQTLDFENRYIHKDGSLRVISWKATPLVNERLMYCIGRDMTEQKQIEEQLKTQTQELEERVKELNCLYGITELVRTADSSLEEILQGTVELIPYAWQYPEITCARLTFEQKSYSSDLCATPPEECDVRSVSKMVSDFQVFGEKRGELSISYLEKRPECDEGPFSQEERNLLNAIAERLGRFIERKQTQEEIARFKTIFDNANFGMAISDIHGNLRYINEYFAAVHGYAPVELIGKHLSLFHNDEQLKDVAEINQQLRERGNYSAMEIWHAHKDGSVFPMLMNGIIITDEKDTPSFMAATGIDITDRKQAEKALRKSEQFSNQILESSLNGLYIYDFEAQANMYINPQYTILTGHTLESLNALSEQAFIQLFHPDDFPMIQQHMNDIRQASDGKALEIEYRFKHANGEWIWCYSRDAVFERAPDGDVRQFIGTFLDITDRKRMEEQLRTALKEKTALLQEIHHRVKNNLLVVSSLLYLQAEKTDNAETRNILEESRHRITSMIIVHEQLYASDNLAEINMAEYLEELTTYMYHACQINIDQIALRLKLDPFILSIVRAIPCGLLVQEMMSNAFKHGFPQGRKGEIFVTFQAADDTLRLSVRNTGAPFPDDVDIYDTTTMGMDLIDSFTTQLRGTLKLDRSDGTTFTVTFPKD